MGESKKTAPVLRPPEQLEIQGFCAHSLSETYHTTYSGQISRYLSSGQQNAVPLKHLEVLTGWDSRTVRRAIEDERRAGVPILADNLTGYYLPATDEDTARCVRSMRHRAAEILKTAAAIERAQIKED